MRRRHVIQYSGGVSSWAAAHLVAERYGPKSVDMLFADTLIEHKDTYAFLEASAADVGGNLIRVADGRTPWQVFKDVKFLGNTRIDPCSAILKRDLLRKYIDEHYRPGVDIMYIGIDWTEINRFERAAPRWEPWELRAPLAEWEPLHDKDYWLALADEKGLPRQALYEAGMPHANCGGGCVKAGQGHFAKLLEHFPETYKEWEENEEDVRQHIGKDVAILRSRKGGVTAPLTLRTMREQIEHDQMGNIDLMDFGGCGCAID